MSRIKRDKLPGPEHEGGGDVDDVERPAAECCRVTGGKFVGLLFDGGHGDRGRDGAVSATPPSEPDRRFSRIRLSGWWVSSSVSVGRFGAD